MSSENEVVFQNTVVDIVATSRYGGKSDVAFVGSTIFLREPADPEMYAEHGDVQTMLDGRMVFIRSTVEVPEEDGRFSVRVSSPIGPAPMMKNGDYSLVVLLPRPGFHPVGPIFDVELVDYSKERAPSVHGAGVLPSIGNRISVSWSARQDPEDVIWYIYRSIGG
ncbi:MAG: hypothetical protein ABR552_05085 [Actinomycetota bacterium]|nr:hypothetical protein [Actinomycetota bacterium]